MAKVEVIANENRETLASLLDLRSASDSVLAYYVLDHPAQKVKIYASYAANGRLNGFLISAQTGLDLFRPLVLISASSRETAITLLKNFMMPPKSILIQVPLDQREWIESLLELGDVHITELLRLDPEQFEPIVNVLVRETTSPDGAPQFEINSKSGAKAIAGLNWKGSKFAEVYVQADAEALERKLAISVLAAACSKLVHENLIPLFRNEAGSLAYEELAAVGFRSTGFRSIMAIGNYKEDFGPAK